MLFVVSLTMITIDYVYLSSSGRLYKGRAAGFWRDVGGAFDLILLFNRGAPQFGLF